MRIDYSKNTITMTMAEALEIRRKRAEIVGFKAEDCPMPAEFEGRRVIIKG